MNFVQFIHVLSMFSSIKLGYFGSAWDSSVKSNFVFLPQLSEGRLSVPMNVIGSAIHMSPIFTFLVLQFRVPSRIAL